MHNIKKFTKKYPKNVFKFNKKNFEQFCVYNII